MRRKAFALFLGLAVFFCSFASVNTFAADEASLTLSSAQTLPGETVELSISIANNPGLCGLRLFVEYDSDVLTLVSAEFTNLFGGGGVEVNTAINPFIMLWNLGTSDFTENGVLALLRFKVKDNAPEGSTAVTLSCQEGDAFNVKFFDVPLSLEGGEVTVTGDASPQNNTEAISGTENSDAKITEGTTILIFTFTAIAVCVGIITFNIIKKKKRG